ncbi:MAG: KpsF/GutQ family sugar-phosphate isomerase [Deltaproteobacteria bacterium]|nr:KpsF/GutQ family sugar-phosphate isomerase [Deltaproteobacteria bacterium]MBN2674461.1 KpsF/GutQ family sugar-phosphate isomerase [Deltaproteobacteria bacterium]
MQAAAITSLAGKINGEFTKAVKIILNTTGHLIICGIGKSGLIGQKMAATFASTGTPSFFVHPAEAYHGDLGMITEEDTIILISNSGETEEIVRLIPYIKQLNIPIIAFAGRANSHLAMHSDVIIDISVDREVCPNNLAPTNSTLATLAMGDALAVSLIKERNFQPHDFAKFHPGGSLGRKLLHEVKDVMHRGALPVVSAEQSVQECLVPMTQGRLGLVLVMEGDKLLGIVTDGDLRRALQKHSDLSSVKIADAMTSTPKTICENARLNDAEEIMKQNKIKALVVLNEDGKVSGILEIFDD